MGRLGQLLLGARIGQGTCLGWWALGSCALHGLLLAVVVGLDSRPARTEPPLRVRLMTEAVAKAASVPAPPPPRAVKRRPVPARPQKEVEARAVEPPPAPRMPEPLPAPPLKPPPQPEPVPMERVAELPQPEKPSAVVHQSLPPPALPVDTTPPQPAAPAPPPHPAPLAAQPPAPPPGPVRSTMQDVPPPFLVASAPSGGELRASPGERGEGEGLAGRTPDVAALQGPGGHGGGTPAGRGGEATAGTGPESHPGRSGIFFSAVSPGGPPGGAPGGGEPKGSAGRAGPGADRAGKAGGGRGGGVAEEGLGGGTRVASRGTGPGGEGQGVAGILQRIRRRIEAARVYPEPARAAGVQGTVEIRFKVAADGSVAALEILRSSGSPLLDAASEETIRRAAPYPVVPGWIRLPLSYRLEDRR